MNKIPYPLKLAIFLVVLGGICGALLAAVNSFTAPRIEELKLEQVRVKLEEVVPLENVEFTEIKDLNKIKGIVTAYLGKVNDEDVAVVYHGSIQGFASVIEALVSVDVNTGNVLGISIVAETETAGKDLRNFNYGLPGNNISNAGTSFKKVSGATISSAAILDLVLNVQTQHAQYNK